MARRFLSTCHLLALKHSHKKISSHRTTVGKHAANYHSKSIIHSYSNLHHNHAASLASSSSSSTVCPLCSSHDTSFFSIQPRLHCRITHRCKQCNLIFVLPAGFVNSIEEKKRYEEHINTHTNKGYMQSINNLLNPLATILQSTTSSSSHPSSSSLHGLDYGSGPTLVLSEIMNQQHGIQMDNFDPYFLPNHALLLKNIHYYDFITSHEVVEHFQSPKEEWKKLTSLIKNPHGILAIATRCVTQELIEAQHKNSEKEEALRKKTQELLESHQSTINSQSKHSPSSSSSPPPHLRLHLPASSSPFSLWPYARDSTHVSFYSEKTFYFIEKLLQYERLYFHENNGIWIGKKI